MTLSIIMVAYNSFATVEQAISSIVNQVYSNIEFIIIDGGSTDGTLDVIKRYANKITYWVSEPDHGIYDAMNKGVRACTGDYVYFIGSDDALVDVNIISQIVAEIDMNTDILSCSVIVVDTESKMQYVMNNHQARDRGKYVGGMIPHQGMFMRRELLVRCPFDTDYKIAADFKFFLQSYYDEKVNFKFIDIPVCFMATGGASGDNTLRQEEYNLIYKELDLPFHDPPRVFTSRIKELIKKLPYSSQFVKYLRKRILWEKHHCNNQICRWCGRGYSL